ncbi:MAG: glycosyltransferase family 2 protein [Candidatus Verstraetearchaeota archaeon]|nr:glycosyltransferase family 2 protein [Candidatus Verstraetearchaeota archaeon]
MEVASAASLVLLSLLVVVELIYLGYHLWLSRTSSKYSTPKGYLPESPTVAFHIPVRGEPPLLLERVLASIKRLRYPKDRIKVVVVCDDEDPRPMEEVCDRARKDLEVVFVHRREPKGFKAGALNEALKIESDVVVVLDVDSILPPDFLINALPSLRESDDVAAVVVRWEPLNAGESPVSEAISFGQKLFTSGLFRGLQAAFKSSILIGCGCILKREALLSAGKWDESCLLEDVELGVRLRLNGCRVVYNDEVPIWIEHPSTYGDFKKQQKRWAYGVSQTFLKHAKAIVTSNLAPLERVSLLIYLTQYWGLALAGLSIIALPVLVLLGGEPPLLPLLPLLGIGAALLIPYGRNLLRQTSRDYSLVKRIRLLGRSSALAVAMALDVFIASLKPLLKVGYGWRVTPKGPTKRASRALPKLELLLSLLLLSTLVIAVWRFYVVLALWSLVYLAPLAYVTSKRFG